MADHDEFDLSSLDYWSLTLDQRYALKRRALERARVERAECIKTALGLLGSALSKLQAALGRAWRNYKIHRRWGAEIATLRGYDDRLLGDVGLTRLDIEILALARPGDKVRVGARGQSR